MDDRGASLAFELMDKDNWEIIDEIDSFLYIFDRMPDQMRLMVDLKMTKMSNKDIAKALKTSVDTVESQLRRAKKRLLRGEFG